MVPAHRISQTVWLGNRCHLQVQESIDKKTGENINGADLGTENKKDQAHFCHICPIKEGLRYNTQSTAELMYDCGTISSGSGRSGE